MAKMSARMQQAMRRAVLRMDPALEYTAGDIVYLAAKESKAAARWLTGAKAGRWLGVLARDGTLTRRNLSKRAGHSWWHYRRPEDER